MGTQVHTGAHVGTLSHSELPPHDEDSQHPTPPLKSVGYLSQRLDGVLLLLDALGAQFQLLGRARGLLLQMPNLTTPVTPVTAHME